MNRNWIFALVIVLSLQGFGFSPKISQWISIEDIGSTKFESDEEFHRWVGKLAMVIIITLISFVPVYMEKWDNIVAMALWIFNFIGSAINIPFLLFADMHMSEGWTWFTIAFVTSIILWPVIMLKRWNINRLERVVG